MAAYRKTHPYDNAWSRGWAARNPAKIAAKSARQRAAKLERIPPWLTKQHWDEIEQIYEHRPPDHHVDHIIPLQGETVSGLHVPWNLQYLTAPENLSKGNKLQEGL